MTVLNKSIIFNICLCVGILFFFPDGYCSTKLKNSYSSDSIRFNCEDFIGKNVKFLLNYVESKLLKIRGLGDKMSRLTGVKLYFENGTTIRAYFDENNIRYLNRDRVKVSKCKMKKEIVDGIEIRYKKKQICQKLNNKIVK